MAQSDAHDEYLQFLGHELRSPLTAVKTALETLQDELATAPPVGTDTSDSPDARLRMVELALRNVRRLNRTVDWSQNLLALAQSTPPAQRRGVLLQDVLPTDLWERFAPADASAADLRVDTDPGLCRMLLRQICSVLEYDGGSQVATVHCVIGADRVTLSLQTVAADNDGCSRPTVASTQLVSPCTDARQEAVAHICRLVSYLVSEHLLEVLDAELCLPDAESDTAVLCLSLPAA